MSINLTVPTSTENSELKPRITVIGVGGAGGNAVNNMIKRELEGVDFVVANTDAQSLTQSSAERRIQLGANLTQGLGAGSKPDIGRGAAEEAIDDVLSELKGVHMVFIAAGMGGGTGTGAAPVIAQAARDAGILTVGVVTKPFQFEGSHRMKMAEEGICELEQHVDTLIIVPNQNLFRIANENTTFSDAFNMADEVLYSGVRGVTDLIVMPGLINLDFADIRSVMEEMGKAMMGTGEANGDRRALDAAEAAIANPLLEDMSMKGAKGVLINITGGQDVTLFEVDEAATRIRAEVDADAHIIVGSAFDPNLDGTMRVSVVATGIDANSAQVPTPMMLNASRAGQKPVVQQVKVLDLEDPVEQPDAITDEAPAIDVVAEDVGVGNKTQSSPLEQLIEEIDASSEALLVPETPEVLEPVTEQVTEPETEPTREAVEEHTEDVAIKAAPAMPTIGVTDAFIPPKPISVEPKPEAFPADSFWAADKANGAPPLGEIPVGVAPKLSLFERVTRTGRAAIGFAGNKPQEQESEMPAVSSALVTRQEAQASKRIESIKAVPEMVHKAAPIDPACQSEIAGLGPQSEPARKESVAEDDILDIPAFLRRQAN
jgi:cell division protein FtsZ